MRKFIYVLFMIFVPFVAACGQFDNSKLEKNEIYFFYQTTCPHCHDAAEYIKINYPNLKMKSLDIKLPGNQLLFRDAVKMYNIDPNMAGTPLITFDDNYIMGWSENSIDLFNMYVKKYMK